MPRVEEGQDPPPRYPDPAGALRSPSEQAFTLHGSPSQKVPHTRASTTAWVTFRQVLLSGTSAQTNPPPGSRKAGHTEHRHTGWSHIRGRETGAPVQSCVPGSRWGNPTPSFATALPHQALRPPQGATSASRGDFQEAEPHSPSLTT